MSPEILLRAVLGLLFLVFAGVWLGGALRAGLNRKFLYASRESLGFALLIRVLVLGSAAGLLGYLYNPECLQWAYIPIPMALRWLGAPLGALGVWIFAATLKVLGPQFSTSLIIRDNPEFITAGPYKWVRHPMYLGYQLVWLGFLFLSANGFIGGAGILAFGLVMVYRTPQEEAMMREVFAEPYVGYCQKTGKFFPKPRLLFNVTRSR
jgi:protein-S-isoprenylcysteine O-methyltransferase Ste14